MTLGTIRQKLRNGEHPEAFGRKFDSGMNRTPYKAGSFIVKLSDCCQCKREAKAAASRAETKLRLAPTVQFLGWDIQVTYSTDCCYPGHAGMDMHAGNIGKDRRGRWVAFDW